MQRKSCDIQHWVICEVLLTGNWLIGPLHFTILSTGSSVVNMMIKTAMYWCCFGLFFRYVHHITKAVMKRE